uniref:Uncharacterized protein n=1 Tax=Heterorhabditis bacteriophora TaxID=37862 RepID=A0A1I7WTM0_HETBA
MDYRIVTILMSALCRFCVIDNLKIVSINI